VIFDATPIDGAFVVRLEPWIDERGYFARTWCRDEFAAHGIEVDMVQASISHNRAAGTLRGMHYSASPSREAKLVRCERGRIFDAIIDLREGSPTFLRQFTIELDAARGDALYIPSQVAHGFQTLEGDSVVLYMMSERYAAQLARGARHDDPQFEIRWPLPVSVIAERDRSWPDFAAGTAH